MDTESSRSVLGSPNPENVDRIEAMNWVSYNIVRQEYPNEQPFGVGLVGSAHINTYQGVAGMANLLGGIGIMTADKKTFDLEAGSKGMDVIVWGKNRQEVKSSSSELLSLNRIDPSKIDVVGVNGDYHLYINLDNVEASQRGAVIAALNTVVPDLHFVLTDNKLMARSDNRRAAHYTATSWQQRISSTIEMINRR